MTVKGVEIDEKVRTSLIELRKNLGTARKVVEFLNGRVSEAAKEARTILDRSLISPDSYSKAENYE